MDATMSDLLRKVRWWVWKFCIVQMTTIAYDDETVNSCFKASKDVESVHPAFEDDDKQGSTALKVTVAKIRGVRASLVEGNFYPATCLQHFRTT